MEKSNGHIKDIMDILSDIKQRITDWYRGYGLLGAVGRSGNWRKTRKRFLKESPFCAVCETKEKFMNRIEVHHCVPFSVDKELELKFGNLITLCRRDHFFVGHLLNWKSWNQNVRDDAEIWRKKIGDRP